LPSKAKRGGSKFAILLGGAPFQYRADLHGCRGGNADDGNEDQ
jgi:hypothetical protein